MGNGFVATFNNKLGSNLTHIANAYGSDILVSFSGDELNIDYVSFKTDLENFGIDCALGKRNFTSTVRVGPRGVHQYRRDNSWEYMTIVDLNGKFLCNNYRIMANKSFIVTQSGVVAKMPEQNNFFKDHQGNIY